MPERRKNGRQLPRREPARPPAPAPARPAGPPRLDATNLAGLTTLMNPQHLRPEADLDRAEQTVMRTASRAPRKSPAEVDPVQLYTKELNALAEELGIDFLDEGGDAAPPPKEAPPGPAPSRARDPLRGKGIDDLLGDIDLGSSSASPSGSEGSASGSSEESSGSGSSGSTAESSEGSGSGSGSGTSSEEGSASTDASVLSRLGKELGINLAGTRRRGKRRDRVRRRSSEPSAEGSEESSRGHRHNHHRSGRATDEQERRRHIEAVMGDLHDETRTVGGEVAERSRDVMASKLEQIGQLRMTLEEEGVDCGGVGDPTLTSPPEEIDSVLNILKLKNDRNRYSSLAEEVILGLAEGIETVLDGSREIPVLNWKPDYTGYHNTVLVKLHRMLFETSSVVGSVIEKHNVGAPARIVMELLPSFFLYPRQQRKQKGAPGLHSDPAAGGRAPAANNGPQVGDARAAISAIRESDVHNPLNSLEAI